jgi:excisionase family DNA binding protein
LRSVIGWTPSVAAVALSEIASTMPGTLRLMPDATGPDRNQAESLRARLGDERYQELKPLSARDVAELTGLNYQTVLAAIHAGELRAKRIRGHFMVTRESYRAWLEPDTPTPRQGPTERPAKHRRGAAPAGSYAAIKAIEREAKERETR